jgi:hypothetical protein
VALDSPQTTNQHNKQPKTRGRNRGGIGKDAAAPAMAMATATTTVAAMATAMVMMMAMAKTMESLMVMRTGIGGRWEAVAACWQLVEGADVSRLERYRTNLLLACLTKVRR